MRVDSLDCHPINKPRLHQEGEDVMDQPLLKSLSAHFECFGYEVQPATPDGWLPAMHPVRYNVLFKPFEFGVRLHCSIVLGPKLPNPEAWYAFLNHANESAVFARFSLAKDADGDWCVRVRGLLPTHYDRRVTGLLLDAWHEDVALLRGAPRVAPGAEDGEEADGEGEKPAVVVN